MQLEDARLHIVDVDGQKLYIPLPDGWDALWQEPILNNHRLPVPDVLREKVQKIAAYPAITAALGFAFHRVHFYELLGVNGTFYRVFMEAVICDHCGHRALISATPGVADIYWGSHDEVAAQERSWSLPLQSCVACRKPLDRRATVWQVND